MRFLPFIMLLIQVTAHAQIPRNEDGVFEYSQTITVTPGKPARLEEKAIRFFDQPFLVHWDTVYRVQQGDNLVLKGKGYVDVRAKLRAIAVPRKIPVWLELTLEVDDDAYRYTFNQFSVSSSPHTVPFTFENKPDSLSQLIYDQVLQKTHQRISFITGWLKRYMDGEGTGK